MRQQQARSSGAPSNPPDSVLEGSTTLAMLTVSTDGSVRAANAGMRRMLGVRSEGELLGRSLADLLAGRRDLRPWKTAFDTGECRGTQLKLRRPGAEPLVVRGDICRIRDSAGKSRLQGVFVDATAEIQSSQALQRSARLEALASLTSGVAHDFNNLLTVLIGNLSLVAEELRDRPELFTKLKASREAAKRGSDLIRQLLGFARNDEVETAVIDAARVIGDLTPLLSRALGSRIALRTNFGPDACRVRANAAQLESAIVNLAVNARDAMESGGSLDIELALVHLAAGEAAAYDLAPGTYVRIKVADDGPGIPKDALEHVFEPFYSTKREKGGTGLGLSMVRAFAQQSDGAVTIRSEPGAGTRVILLLPSSSEHLDETNSKTMPLNVLPTGDERVLVSSSDEALRSTVRQILETLGYRVRHCEPGDLPEMIDEDVCDLLISDGPPGSRAAGKGAGAPSVPRELRHIVLSSGGQTAAGVENGRSRVLLKPFSLADLAQLVRATLDGT